ncbi:hypothetical protein Plano_0565 [Planococcus sp. PAMC 21323]|uniref:GmrSD restriction endonuclease domain-containing protein n=1 Tax=Planococcus sp. PAMC 21323 TaxID=1526927 RepID=UPI00057105A9|nr:DUF262 domain-containing protein [Planococcus sp. PAMC 21323]AIY04530.1 hypothetical protein Plano_0565 [Planococcus sp. PAMC 21323]
MSNYTVSNTTINALISWIEQDIIAIPEIQRPFVWDAIKVRDLIDSLYKDYPVGYIITWQNPNIRLKDGSISSGKKILIDGQQRVTALMAALAGLEVVDKDYKRRGIKIAFNPLEERFEVSNPAIEKNSRWISNIAKLFLSSFSTFAFVNEYCSKNIEANPDAIHKVLQNLVNIRNSSIGIIDLSHNLDIEKVTEIFIRINSAGVVLSQADFAISKITSNEDFNGPTIRKTIDYFSNLIRNPEVFKNIKTNDTDFSGTLNFRKISWVSSYNTSVYEPSYSDLLRVAFTFKFRRGKLANLVSLLSGRDFETRENKSEIIESSFKDLEQAVLQFVDETNFKRFVLIVKSAGIIDKKLIRSQNALNFAYILFLLLREKGFEGTKINHIVRRWLVLSILTQRYSSSPESQFEYDVKKFADTEDPLKYLKDIEEGELSEAFWNNVLVSSLDTSVTSSPFFNLFIMAQIYEKDFAFLSKSVTIQHLIEERGDIHHVFPKDYLKKNGFTNRSTYNQIANYVYTEQVVNLAVRNKPPKLYLSKVLSNDADYLSEISTQSELDKNFEMNAVPKVLYGMEALDYQEFLLERRKLMAKKIERFYKSL